MPFLSCRGESTERSIARCSSLSLAASVMNTEGASPKPPLMPLLRIIIDGEEEAGASQYDVMN